MSNLILPRREIWTRQPQIATAIDQLDWAYNPAIDRVIGYESKPSLNAGAIIGVREPGKTLILPNGGYCDVIPAASVPANSGTFLICGSASQGDWGSYTGSVTERIGGHIPYSGTVYFDWGGYTSGVTRLSVAAGTTSIFDRWIFTNGPRGMEIWRNGVLVASQASNPSFTQASNQIGLGIYGVSTGKSGAWWLFAGSKRQIPKEVCADLTRKASSPWKILIPRKPRLFVFASAAGGSTINASATGQSTATGTASLSAQVALAAIGVSTATGTANASASIPLSAAGIAIADGTANAQATVTISAAGLAQAAGQAGLSAAILLQGAGAAQSSGNAPLAAQLNALATGAANAAGTANLTGGAPGELSASGQAQADGSAVLSVTIGVSATGGNEAAGSANLTGGAPGQIAATGGAQADGSAVASATVALTAAGFVAAMGAGAWSVTVPLSAFGGAVTTGGAQLTELGNIVFIRAPSGAGPVPLSSNGRRFAQPTQMRPANTGGRR